MVHVYQKKMSDEIGKAVALIYEKRIKSPRKRSTLVGISGIDGCGKTYLAEKIVSRLQKFRLKAVVIGVDGWLNLPSKRFSQDDPAENFYQHAIRFKELFQELVLPLKQNRRHKVVADFTEETATEYRKHLFSFEDVDIVVLEGIYLFKPAYRHHFDVAFWIECTCETALERALQRRQEGLSPDETTLAYETIYFPAQRLHFAKENPQAAADAVIKNDPRLAIKGIVDASQASQEIVPREEKFNEGVSEGEGAR